MEDNYLKLCQSCDSRSPAKHFRYVMGKRVCLHCADFLEEQEAYRPETLAVQGSRQRGQQKHTEPPSRWSERKGNHVPHWMGDGRPKAAQQVRKRNEGKPDVMDARAPKRRPKLI